MAVGHGLEHERLALAGHERELAFDARSPRAGSDRPPRRGERQRRRPEDDAVLVHDRLVILTPVVEARVDLDPEAHLAVYAEHAADEPLARARRA